MGHLNKLTDTKQRPIGRQGHIKRDYNTNYVKGDFDLDASFLVLATDEILTKESI